MRKILRSLLFTTLLLSACTEEEKYHPLTLSTMRFEELKPAASAGKELRTVDFFSATQGIVGGAGGLLLTTVDGGQTWQTLTPNPGLGTVNKLLMTSPTAIWA